MYGEILVFYMCACRAVRSFFLEVFLFVGRLYVLKNEVIYIIRRANTMEILVCFDPEVRAFYWCFFFVSDF